MIVPVLNAAKYIERAITSATTQDPPPAEIVVQDGGSTDGTLEVLQGFGEQVNVESRPDQGQADALNRAIARSTGDVFVWLNADDLLAPGALAAVDRTLHVQPDAEFVYGDFEVVDAEGAVLRTFRSSPYNPRRVFVHGCYIFSGTMFMRRELIERVGPFDAGFQACMDFDYLMRIGDVKAAHTGRTLAQFRMAGEQKSTRMRSRFLRESHAIRWRAAGPSLRRRMLTLVLDARDAAYMLTQRMRMARAWSAIRGTRQL